MSVFGFRYRPLSIPMLFNGPYNLVLLTDDEPDPPSPTKTMASTSDQQDVDSADDEVFPFLDLSAGLRNLVYENVLVKEDPIHLLTELGWGKPTVRHNILKTCKLIHFEAAPVLYSQNTFAGSAQGRNEAAPIPSLIRSLGASVQHLRKVTIYWSASKGGMKKAFTVLKAATLKLDPGLRNSRRVRHSGETCESRRTSYASSTSLSAQRNRQEGSRRPRHASIDSSSVATWRRPRFHQGNV